MEVIKIDKIIIWSNFFVNKNTIAPGVISKPIESIIPTEDKVATTVIEVNEISIKFKYLLFIPKTFVWTSSNEKSIKSFLFINRRLLTNIEIEMLNIKFSFVIPRIFPKRIWSRCRLVETFVISTKPIPNIPENTTPNTVSFFILLFSLIKLEANEQKRPATKAPIINGILNIYAKTIPGRTAWLMASPIRDQPLRTR